MSGSTLTPRQAALAVGVSESSVRRWCDTGRLRGQRTAGGHRRIRESDLFAFARDNGIRVSSQGVRGARNSGGREASPAELITRARLLAISGDNRSLRQLFADYLGEGRSVARLFDQIVAPAMHSIGGAWATGNLNIYEEHRATETIRLVLASCKDIVVWPEDNAPVALSCALAPDTYCTAPLMTALVLQESGFRNLHLGANTPPSAVQNAIAAAEPALVVISVSSVTSETDTARSLQKLRDVTEQNDIALALGGRALSKDLRKKLSADFFGDTMEHLRAFANQVGKRVRSSKGIRNDNKP